MKARFLIFLFLWIWFAGAGLSAPPLAGASSGTQEISTSGSANPPEGLQDCVGILEVMRTQQQEMAQELRSIKRELAALKATQDQPEFKDVIGGIGYILGLFGIAFYVHARRDRRRQGS